MSDAELADDVRDDVTVGAAEPELAIIDELPEAAVMVDVVELLGWLLKFNKNYNFGVLHYRDKICVYDEHPIAGRDIQCRASNSQSR